MVKFKLNLFLLFVIVSTKLFSQDFEILTSVNKSKIYRNEQLVLTLTVKGTAKDIFKSIEMPNFKKDFRIISSSESSSFSLINGVANRLRQYRYTLLPIEPGMYIIDPFKVTYEGKQYSTKPLPVNVREGTIANTRQQRQSPIQQSPQIKSQNFSQSIFLETQISTNNIFLGESISYSIKLYRRISLWRSISINQDDLQGVWQNSFDLQPEKVVTKLGQRYYEIELVNKEIRPLNEGELIIPPLTARFIVNPLSGEYQLQSKVVTINVQSLPDPKPLSFTGAIGDYEITAIVPEQNSSSNTFQIQVIIQGQGNVSAITAPVIQDTNQYRVLSAPKSSNQDDFEGKVFDYVIIPKVQGTIDIPPIEFSFFSKDIMDYITLNTQSFSFEVSPELIDVESTENTLNEDIQFLVDNSIFYEINAKLNEDNIYFSIISINLVTILLMMIMGIFLQFKSGQRFLLMGLLISMEL